MLDLKKSYVLPFLLFVIFMAFSTGNLFAQCINQCPVISNVNINSCEGVITVSVSGDAPFSYDWRDSGGNQVATDFIATGLVPDNYTVTVTDADGDTETATYTVTNPPNLVGTVVVNDVTCRGDSDAQVVVTMTNGNPTYEWELLNAANNPIGDGQAAPFSNVITLGGLTIGAYTLVVTDANGCTGSIPFTITQPTDFLGFSLGSQTDATCFNGADGSLTVNATGGWGDYIYEWIRVSDGSSLGSAATINGLTPGDYRLIIIDRNGTGCTLTTPDFTIGSPPEIQFSADISATQCQGDANGSIDLSVSGGVAAYTYSWSNGATTQDISGLTAGDYTITLTDGSGCVANQTFTVTEPSVLAINPDVTDVACFGDATGEIESRVTGGTAPYTFSWSEGSVTENLSGMVAGSYDLTVIDANGCSVTMNNIIVNEPALALAKQAEALAIPSCAGGNDGSVSITMQGGTAPYTYSWSNGSSTSTATGLTAGSHTVSVTDQNGCTYQETFTLNDPPAINVTQNLTQPSCFGAADGVIVVSASNGTAPYTYSWNTGASGTSINGLVAGNYSVTVTDGAGCSIIHDIVLGEPNPLNDNATVNPISCNGAADGSIFLAVSGGTGPYTYSWNTGASTNNLVGLSAGNYSVQITDDNGCTLTENFVLTDPDVMSVNFTTEDILCKGAATGEINLSPIGGTAPYQFLWSNGSTTEDVSGLPAGNYSVTITDAGTCSVNLNITLSEPATVLVVDGTVTNSTCSSTDNGSIDLVVTGGDGPYGFSWNNGATTEDLSNLSPGNYAVSVTDANGCIQSQSFTVSEPAPLGINPTVNDITCNGAEDGSLEVVVNGGTAPYSYSWADDGAVTTNQRSGLSPGNYTVTVTDAQGCQTVGIYSISEPDVLEASAVLTQVLCFGEPTGEIQLTPSGGTAPYTFSWSNGELSEDLTQLNAGSYQVVVTDAAGCTFNAPYEITQPASVLQLSTAVNQITCNGAADGNIELTVSGGAAPYNFNWSHGSAMEDQNNLPAGNYTVIVTDDNGCTLTESFTITDPPLLTLTGNVTQVDCHGANNGTIELTTAGGEGPYSYQWSNGETTKDVTGLSPGNYNVIITDARGCTRQTNFSIVEPQPLDIQHTTQEVSCFGQANGAVNITVNGGTAPYVYSWSNAATTEDINDVSAGNYTVTVTDAGGCILSKTIAVSEPNASLSTAGNISNINCFGGQDGVIQLTTSGGTPPYQYAWNHGPTTRDVAGLSEGNYQVTITDAKGCSIQEQFQVDMPAALTVSGTVQPILCNGQATGSIDLTVAGGTPPYQFTWNNGENSEDLTNIEAGSYQVSIADAAGCSLTRNFQLSEPLALTLNTNIGDVTCFGEQDGFIDVSVSGGVAPYSFSWSTGESTSDLFNLSGGDYTLTLTDGNGCIKTETFTVEEATAALSATAQVTPESCFNDNQGAIDLEVNGGTPPYTYAWNQGSATQDISGLNQGVYQVIITDSKGCSVTRNETIAGPDVLQISAIIQPISCFQAEDGELDITVSGGTAPYTFTWSNGSIGEDVQNLGPGNYSLQVIDALGCTVSGNWNVNEPLPLVINAQSTDISCFGEENGEIQLTVSGGTAPYQYAWQNGASIKDLTAIAKGNYEVMVTDARGCLIQMTMTINGPDGPLAAVENITDTRCADGSDGSVSLAVSGGTPPYQYSWSDGSNQKDLLNAFAGNYQVTITDNVGCQFVQSYQIGEPPALDVSFDVRPASCLGDKDGAIFASPSGGIGPYSFVWSSGTTSQNLTNISGGTYQLTLLDAQGCSITKSVEVGDSSNLKVAVQKQDVLCKGDASGSIDLKVTGGTGNYTYAWNTGAITSELAGVAAGVYEVLITDESGCSSSQTIVISEPDEILDVNITGFEDLLCFGANNGRATAMPEGGIAPYTFLWSNGARTQQVENLTSGTYTVNVTDANGCTVQASATIAQPDAPITILAQGNLSLSCKGASDGRIALDIQGGVGNYDLIWNTGERTTSISELSVGDYTVRVRDGNGCVEERTFTITEPEELSIEDAIVNESKCFDANNGSILLNTKGGVAPYSYQWSTGATEKNLVGISSGVYDVRVTDANGCTVSANFNLADPGLFRLSPQVKAITCVDANDASISLNIEGGVGNVAIKWNTGASTEALTGLRPGQYNVVVTDETGCALQQTFNIPEPLPLSLDAFIEEASACNNPESGLIQMIVTGGTAPYKYRWSNGETTSTLTDILPGTYVVTVNDSQGCEAQGTYTVLQPEPLRIGLSTEPFIDCESRIAAIRVKAEVTGGVGNYSFSWSRGSSATNEVFLTEPGRLSIEITDDRGCYQQNAIDIKVPELGLADFEYNAPSIDITGELAANDPVSFFDLSQGEVVDWRWEFGDGFGSDEIDPIHTYDAPGTFQVSLTVTDRTGCQTVKTTTLEITEGYRIIVPNAFTPNKDGKNDFFRPSFLGLEKVKWTIYNTWGEVVFSTEDLETKGWDGIIRGQEAENGNYVYKLTGWSVNGLKVERQGIFMLLK